MCGGMPEGASFGSNQIMEKEEEAMVEEDRGCGGGSGKL